jgi:phage terminase large subunit-like protein
MGTSELASITQAAYPLTWAGHKDLRGLLRNDLMQQPGYLSEWCKVNLWALLTIVLGRKDMEQFGPKTEWLYQRVREVALEPNGRIDLWPREHYKSTIITFGLTIQEILKNPEVTVGIFSHTRPASKAFLRQIKREFEQNDLLKVLYPSILWAKPEVEAPKWTEDDGVIVKRKSNPKESTIEAWGLVDGQPIGRHFQVMVYDDVVTRDSVTSPEMMKKTTEALELSYALGTKDGVRRFVGTRYHMRDSYQTVIDRKTATPRVYQITKGGRDDGEPVLFEGKRVHELRRDMGPYTFAAQMQQNPFADKAQGFRREWVRYHKDVDGVGGSCYILVDPANTKKQTSDWTSMVVVELGADRNYYLCDAVYDRLNLTERTNELIRLHRKWNPTAVGYEHYGMQADIEHIKYVQEKDRYRFGITELAGRMPKNDRIRRLIPLFEQGRMFLPTELFRKIYDGRTIDLIEMVLTEEYDVFPLGVHDDFLDCLSRILDEDLYASWPVTEGTEKEEKRERYKRKRSSGSSWAA